jgi:hypothetical protein
MKRPLLIALVTAALMAILAACTPTAAPSAEQPDMAATQAAMEKTQVAVADLQSELQQTQAALGQQTGDQAENAPSGSAEQAAPAGAAEAAGGSEPETELIDVVLQQTRQFKGEADAPVKVIMFSDFQ